MNNQINFDNLLIAQFGIFTCIIIILKARLFKCCSQDDELGFLHLKNTRLIAEIFSHKYIAKRLYCTKLKDSKIHIE